METLSFDFGCTPREVIRERLEAADSWPALFKLSAKGLDIDLDIDDLLTVLDALAKAGDDVIRTEDRIYEVLDGVNRRRYGTVRAINHTQGALSIQFDGLPGCEIRSPHLMPNRVRKDNAAARKLRISILAALGVDES